jgi:hypothetical protein
MEVQEGAWEIPLIHFMDTASYLTSPASRHPNVGNIQNIPPPGPLRPAMYPPCDWGCCSYAPDALLAAGVVSELDVFSSSVCSLS